MSQPGPQDQHEPRPRLDPEPSTAPPCALIVQEPESPTDSSPSSVASKRVTFDRLHIQEYPVILGDHPATSSGLPVTLDWTVANYYQLEVNQYENAATRRRAGLELRMPPEVRRELLHETCADKKQLLPDDLQRVARDLRRTKDQRRHTIAMQDFETLHIFLESAARKWKRWKNSWNDDVDQDPAAIWLKQWQLEKKVHVDASNLQRRSSDSSINSILKNSNTQASMRYTTDVDSSESTRMTSATSLSENTTDLSSDLLTTNAPDLLATGLEDARVILSMVDREQAQSHTGANPR